MINMSYLYAAMAICVIVIVADLLKRKYNVDLNNFNYKEFMRRCKTGFKYGFKPLITNKNSDIKVIERTTGNNSLILLNSGENKATVMATLRQITGLGYTDAKTIVESAPVMFMTNISEKEADLTKKALEFVGAEIEIK